MTPPALMTPAELNSYAAGLSRLAKQIRGRVGEYLNSAAKDIRLQVGFGGEDQRRFGR